MSVSGLAIFIRVYDASTGNTQSQLQNFFVGSTVDGYEFRSFNSSDVLMNRSASEGGLTIQLAATAENLNLFEQSLDNEWMVQVTMYELPVEQGLADLSGAVVVARFLGEVLGVQTNLTELAVEIGTALSAVDGNIPGRRITTSLVGRLPTL